MQQLQGLKKKKWCSMHLKVQGWVGSIKAPDVCLMFPSLAGGAPSRDLRLGCFDIEVPWLGHILQVWILHCQPPCCSGCLAEMALDAHQMSSLKVKAKRRWAPSLSHGSAELTTT